MKLLRWFRQTARDHRTLFFTLPALLPLLYVVLHHDPEACLHATLFRLRALSLRRAAAAASMGSPPAMGAPPAGRPRGRDAR